jgi:cysteine desulfurase
VTGPLGHRVYLDWNATAPLRPEARAAMLAAMDAGIDGAGNPSSVHSEGRVAKAIVERARAQVAELVGCEPGEVVFTSGATEAAALAVHQSEAFSCSPVEHDCVFEHADNLDNSWSVTPDGAIIGYSEAVLDWNSDEGEMIAVTAANNETGVLNDVRSFSRDRHLSSPQPSSPLPSSLRPSSLQPSSLRPSSLRHRLLVDAVQVAGKTRVAFRTSGAEFFMVSAHKIGGPKGAGALIAREGLEVAPILRGGGQEMRRRSGTENIVGIAGFGAAGEAAQRDLEAGIWGRVEKLRDALETVLADAAPDLHIFGKDAPRLPNTSCFGVPGWKGETQVMQMDLAGFAVSAGSACSSGKTGPSRVLLAMGFDEETAASAIRVSMGPTTTEAEVMGFADTWIEHYRRRKARAA